jgi:hypothetical protein
MFTKGQSGNPSGRPKKQNSLTSILRELGDIEDVSYNGSEISRKRAIAEALWQKAIVDKDFSTIRYLYDRLDGMPRQAVELSGEDGDPIQVKVIFE